MTELHNMSVPPRSTVTLQREELHGRRYRVAIGKSAIGCSRWPDDAVLTRCFREDGVACALAMLNPGPAVTVVQLRNQIAKWRRAKNALATLRQRCAAALSSLHLPDGFGFFVNEMHGTCLPPLSIEAALAILSARSGPLYLPGRFEPSLITAGAVTLFFPSFETGRGVR